MAHGFVSGNRMERAAMYRDMEARNRQSARDAASTEWGGGFDPSGIIRGHTFLAEEARIFAERYED